MERKNRACRYINEEDMIMTKKTNSIKSNPFIGCTIVAVDKLDHLTRSEINGKIISIGANKICLENFLLQRLGFADIIKTGYPSFWVGRISVEWRKYAEEDAGL